MRKALITGITGQDGSHLAELLLAKGYRIYGLTRSSGNKHYPRLDAIRNRIELIPGDLVDAPSLIRAVTDIQPDEVYNLAAMSSVAASWQQPRLTAAINADGVLHLLEAVRRHCPKARFFQASTSEMFGPADVTPQSEATPFQPRNPYGHAKLVAHKHALDYRANHGLFACCGILFNHEGPRRGAEFVTRKITQAVARISVARAGTLALGNLAVRRDWGYAEDYVRAMWLMLQQDRADDYVIGTGATHSVEEFVQAAFDHGGLDWRAHVVIDPTLCRPVETGPLVADASKARRVLGWQPEVSFEDMVRMMVDADLRVATPAVAA